nr:hypothetical protein [Alkalicoccobacillus plakortidis]
MKEDDVSISGATRLAFDLWLEDAKVLTKPVYYPSKYIDFTDTNWLR